MNPCGFIDKGVTSMQQELGKMVDTNLVKSKLQENFMVQFNIDSLVNSH